jgi:hypothetical protein
MLATLLLSTILAASPEAADTVVVCPKAFVPALEPWLAHRYRQGRRFVHVPNTWTKEEIRNAIRHTAQQGKLRAVVLVGDAEPQAEQDERVRQRTVPTHLTDAVVNVKFGSEPQIATDNWYADLDDDGTPEVAVGRIPADSAEELSRLVRRILQYEQAADHTTWRQQVNFIAGVGGFGGLVDSVTEMATRQFLSEGIPAGYNTSMTYASLASPYCPDPRRFHETTVNRFNEGCLFWVYIGHGHPNGLDRITIPGGQYPILEARDVKKLKPKQGSPIAVFLACYTGAFDREQDCLAEEMLRAEGGPVAVLAGSRVTMPYAMAVMGNEMLHEYFERRPETLGEVLLNTKRRMLAAPDAKDVLKNANRHLLDALASVLSPTADQLPAERLENVQLFNLLGDPLLRLSHPAQVELTAAREVVAGEAISVVGKSPVAGTCVLELCCKRDGLKFPAPDRSGFLPNHATLAKLQETYVQANDRTWTRQSFPVPAGEFSVTIETPAECRGACQVRAFVTGNEKHALGAASLFVKSDPPTETKTVKTERETKLDR